MKTLNKTIKPNVRVVSRETKKTKIGESFRVAGAKNLAKFFDQKVVYKKI